MWLCEGLVVCAHLQSLSSQLSALVRSLSGEAANLSQPEVKKFLSQHAFSVFKQELLTFLRSVVESLGEPLLYKVGYSTDPHSTSCLSKHCLSITLSLSLRVCSVMGTTVQ